MAQLTLVAGYGPKPQPFTAFIEACQDLISDTLGERFLAYDPHQVHATLIGLERIEGSQETINRHFYRSQKSAKAMDFHGFLAFLREQIEYPITVQIGGYENSDYPFRSRDKTPYERSFSVQGDKVVAMGWPVTSAVDGTEVIYPETLNMIRRSAQRFHIRHAYHRVPTDVDNDFFFRLGLIADSVPLEAKTSAQLAQRVREYMRTMPPILLAIQLSDLAIAVYQDEPLPLDSTQVFSLADARVDGDFIARCYND